VGASTSGSGETSAVGQKLLSPHLIELVGFVPEAE